MTDRIDNMGESRVVSVLYCSIVNIEFQNDHILDCTLRCKLAVLPACLSAYFSLCFQGGKLLDTLSIPYTFKNVINDAFIGILL